MKQLPIDKDDPEGFLQYMESGYHDVEFPKGNCKKCGKLCQVNWARFPRECQPSAIIERMYNLCQ